MRKLAFALIALAMVGGGLLYASPAECVWCPSFRCWSSGACGQCTCIVGPGQSSGSCYGLQHAEDLADDPGYRVLP